MAAWRSRADAKEGIALRAPFNQRHTPNKQGPEGRGGKARRPKTNPDRMETRKKFNMPQRAPSGGGYQKHAFPLPRSLELVMHPVHAHMRGKMHRLRQFFSPALAGGVWWVMVGLTRRLKP